MHEMVRTSHFWFYISLTAFVFSVAGWFSENVLDSDPIPYRDVDVIDAHVEQSEFVLVANFRKTDCRFVQLVAMGHGLDGAHALPWSDYDGHDPNMDRTIGLQTLRIAVDLSKHNVDRIEIRTRHDCDGEKVDKIFMEYTL